MGYKALYRVYRPRTFDEVVGQEHICDVLKKQVEKNLVSHAYIFSGPRGTGKTSTARIFANAVNCLHPVGGNPCLACEVCKSASNDTMIDIVEMDAASNNSVDNIRDMREKASLLPAFGRYKVYILDEAHMLSGGAVNALLKTLEEPPPHVIFILATTEIRKIPKTILSRCQQFDFKRIKVEDIAGRLEKVAQEAGITCEKEALLTLARAGEGALRDALSLMDMCVADGKTLTAADVVKTVGTADAERLALLGDAVIGADTNTLLTTLHGLLAEGGEPGNILRDMIGNLSERLVSSVSDGARSRLILRAIEVLIYTQSALRYSNTPDIVLEAAFMRAALPETDADAKDLMLRVERLEKRLNELELPPKKAELQPKAADLKAGVQRSVQSLEKAVHEKESAIDEEDMEMKLIKMLGVDKVEIKD